MKKVGIIYPGIFVLSFAPIGCQYIIGLSNELPPNPCSDVQSSCTSTPPVQVTHGLTIPDLEKISTEVDLAPFPEGWGMVFKKGDDSHPNLWFATVSKDAAVNNFTQITENQGSYSPSISAGGSGFGIAWEEKEKEPEIDFMVDFVFINYQPPIPETFTPLIIADPDGFAKAPSIVWNGSDFGIVWQDSRNGKNEIWFARINESGNFVISPMRIGTLFGDSTLPDIAWASGMYSVVFLNNSTGKDSVYGMIVDQQGNVTSEKLISASSGKAGAPRIMAEPSGLAIVWTDNSPGETEIFFTKTDFSLNPVIPLPIQVTQCAIGADLPDLIVRIEGENIFHDICWQDSRGGITNVYATTLDSNGNKLSFELQVSSTQEASSKCKFALSKSGESIFWATGSFTNREIFMTYFSCI